MNEIVKDSRHKIDTACTRCFLALDRHGKAVDAFNQERRRIEALPYIQEEKERMVSKAEEALSAAAAAEYGVIHESLEAARTAAGEMDRLLDIGEDFQNTLAVVKTLGKGLPAELRGRLAEPFRGQRQALLLLKAAYEAAEIDPELYFKGLIFDSSARVDGLDNLAHRLTIQPQGNLLAAVDFAGELEKFAEGMGVELTRRFRDMVDISGALTDTIRQAAGLGTAD